MLLKSLGVELKSTVYEGYDIGSQLKSISGWKDSGNGTNSSGFDAVPSGGGKSMSWIDTSDETSVLVTYPIGERGCWWTSGMWEGAANMFMNLSYKDNFLYGFPAWPENQFSVRCVKNE